MPPGRPALFGALLVNWDHSLRHSPCTVRNGIGHFLDAIDIDGFIDKDEFKKQIDDGIQVFRNTKPAPETIEPSIPGEPEQEAEAIRAKKEFQCTSS